MTNGSRPSPSPSDRIRVMLLACLPQHAVSRLTLRLTRLRTRLKDPVVRWFIRTYGADMTEAAESDPAAYPSFNAFFTRPLRPGVRPIAGDESTPVSPVDGRVSQAGRIEAGRLYQAKGIDYGLVDLLGGDPRDAEPFMDGAFATLYLAPGDYHRIHMPLTGRLRRMCHVPGRLWSVAPWTVRSIPDLFARNERVVALFDTDRGPLALVLVGAINVAAIETVWAGLVTPPRGRSVIHTGYGDTGPRIERGSEMGRFNMGSTVIVLAPPGVPLDNVPAPGERVRVGMALAREHGTSEAAPSMA